MSILIGLYVKQTLEGSADLQKLTGGRIAPVVFPEDDAITAPYVYFSRQGLTESDSKDGLVGESVSVVVSCVGSTYEEMLLLAHTVREALRSDFHNRGGDFSDMPFTVTDMSLSVGPEEFDPTTCEYLTDVQADFETEEK